MPITKKHTKLYYQYFGYDESDPYIPCELTGINSVDINHIDARGMGGSKEKDYIENLMASPRKLHDIFGDKKHLKDFLKMAHLSFMETRIPYIDIDPFHKAFDELLKHSEYKKIVQWKRQQQ